MSSGAAGNSEATDYVRSRCIKCGSIILAAPSSFLHRCSVCRTVNTTWADSTVNCQEPVPTPTLVEQCMHWNESQVNIFLKALHTDASLAKTLQDNLIDGPQLLDLTYSDLVQIGIKPEEAVKTLLTRVDIVRNTYQPPDDGQGQPQAGAGKK